MIWVNVYRNAHLQCSLKSIQSLCYEPFLKLFIVAAGYLKTIYWVFRLPETSKQCYIFKANRIQDTD